MDNTDQKGWREEFDARFTDNYAYGSTIDPHFSLIKDFIERTLTAQREEMVKRGLGLIKQCKTAKPADEVEEIDERAYIAACNDFIALIKDTPTT